jgi:hypothetical protein
MLNAKTTTVRFRSPGECWEAVIGVGLYVYGIMLGGKFENPQTFLHMIVSERDALSCLCAFLLSLAVGMAFFHTYSAITFLILINCQRCVTYCARLEDESASGNRPWTRLYEKCGCKPLNYIGNPYIAISNGYMIIINPFLGAILGAAVMRGNYEDPLPYLSLGLFLTTHALFVVLRTSTARQFCKCACAAPADS